LIFFSKSHIVISDYIKIYNTIIIASGIKMSRYLRQAGGNIFSALFYIDLCSKNHIIEKKGNTDGQMVY
jgi:hypothetical protein